MKRVLMVAFHYPPAANSTGWQRAYYFSKYFQKYGWEPIVLTANYRAYEHHDSDLEKLIPPQFRVVRSFALDSFRHLSIGGKYFRWAALPDRWITWVPDSVVRGVRLVKKYRPQIIYSTFPIPTAILIGFLVHRLTGVPWVVDLRDPMIEHDYPVVASMRKVYSWLERIAVRNASRLVFNAPSAAKLYIQRYGATINGKTEVVLNGFDETLFRRLPVATTKPNTKENILKIVHTGLLYSNCRNPVPLIEAVSRLKKEGDPCVNNVKFEFIGHKQRDYSNVLSDNSVSEYFGFYPHVSLNEALNACASADALLIMQGRGVNYQIPGKIYEYMQFNKPILGLTSQQGDTASVLRNVGGSTIVEMENSEAIYKVLPRFIKCIKEGTSSAQDESRLMKYTWKAAAERFAKILDDTVPAIS